MIRNFSSIRTSILNRREAAINEFTVDAAAAAELELAADAASFLVETPHGVMSAREALDSDLPIWSMR